MPAPLKPTDHRMGSLSVAAERCIQVDDLQFAIRRSARRRTMQITVERTGELILSAPPDVGISQLRDFIIEKRFWIYTKLAEKDRLQRQVPRKEFVNGEGFLYLGRSHRLKLVEHQDAPLKLANGRFALRQDVQDTAREHFIRWYSERAVFGCPAASPTTSLAWRSLLLALRFRTSAIAGALAERATGCIFIGRPSCCQPVLPSTWSSMKLLTCTSHITPPLFGYALSVQCPIIISARPGWPNTELMLRGYKTWRNISPLTISSC